MFDECNLTRSSRPAGAVVTAPGPGLSSHDGLALACHCRLTCSESHWRSSAKGLGPGPGGGVYIVGAKPARESGS